MSIKLKSFYLYRLLRLVFAFIWLLNGLYCKVLNLVPRHQQIVQSVLHIRNARTATCLIGVAEIMMAIWIISGYQHRLNMIIQIAVIAVMNIIEVIAVPDLLLFGRLNTLLASVLVSSIYINETIIRKSNICT